MASPMISRLALRARRSHTLPSQWVRRASMKPLPPRSSRASGLAKLAFVAASGAAAAWAYTHVSDDKKDEPPRSKNPEIVFEAPRKDPASKGEDRDQVKRSWERPGVYVWGSNAGKVVAPDSNEAVVKTPRRLPYFDGQILRDLKLDRDFGAAITETGDLVQWGVGYSKTTNTPAVTLQGKDLVKLALSRDRIIALSSSGSVFSIPVSRADQESGDKPIITSWVPFWSQHSPLSYRSLVPQNLGWGEKVVDITGGLDHCLLLTSKGRVFSAASSTVDFPSKGQLGIPGLTWQTRPEGPYYQPHEVKALRGSPIKAIAAGDFHSLALDSDGNMFSFGDNSSGQLGFDLEPGSPYIAKPLRLPVNKLYSGTNLLPKVTSIAAGGMNSYFTVDATKTQATTSDGELMPTQDVGKIVADTWACGEGIKGSLGNGKWWHYSKGPTKVKALSNLYEYNEAIKSLSPIRLAYVSVGSTHACAIMDNVTNLLASKQTSKYDSNSGADTLWWGFNEYYQLGTGKRSNANTPVYIRPLDSSDVGTSNKKEVERERLQLAPRTTIRLGEGGIGRKASVEQRVECGRHVTAVYSAT
ncbi:regulator of chromosome condensation 1/beta-lactamase-inhibitor protein II [Lasiosphaeria ovina]|uniref:Regulator of chromosome condensation 1/beta-lactamase-inhibitor protein II n=1 Tax=Lasiosphaeria ovina TaxID=92902 RepID=A0AAE0KHL9_9PEZI|nr:regulator of chromosome condensation 1/beta-lactamase-inhibitor protein II [Lasiosphaeria ovina]